MMGDQATGSLDGMDWGLGYFNFCPLTWCILQLFTLFCTVNWLDAEGLNIKVGLEGGG